MDRGSSATQLPSAVAFSTSPSGPRSTSKRSVLGTLVNSVRSLSFGVPKGKVTAGTNVDDNNNNNSSSASPKLDQNNNNSSTALNGLGLANALNNTANYDASYGPSLQPRRLLFGLSFLSSITNLIRQHPSSDEQITHNERSSPPIVELPHQFMSNSPTIANLANYTSEVATGLNGHYNNHRPEELDGIPELKSTNELSEEVNVSSMHDIPSSSTQPSVSNFLLPKPTVSQTQTGATSQEKNTNNNSSTNNDNTNNNNPAILNGTRVQPTPVTSSNVPSSSTTTNQTSSSIPLQVGGESSAPSLPQEGSQLADSAEPTNGLDKDGFYLIRLTPLIDHSLLSLGLYFAPIIRKLKPSSEILIGRYTERNKLAAHAPQGSLAPVVFKSKVVSRIHALFSCNEEGQWFLKDCKSSSGTFLNHIRLSQALQELQLMPLIDGDIIQLGMDYRGGTEEVYRCVKMKCEFNKSWQRKVNQFNLEIHKKLKNLAIGGEKGTNGGAINNSTDPGNPLSEELLECAICLLKLEPCQAMFISPCLHLWHYKCIRPIIIKSYPQFYCPNCRSMCDLETDIEDDD